MQYIKHHLENILGIEIYPLISLLIFFIFFVALFYYVLRADKGHIDEMRSKALDLSDADSPIQPNLKKAE